MHGDRSAASGEGAAALSNAALARTDDDIGIAAGVPSSSPATGIDLGGRFELGS
jgi:hypothetical protein